VRIPFRSLRRRYVVETALAITALVVAFAVVTLAAVSLRLLIVAEGDAHTVVASLGDVDEGVTDRIAAVLRSFSSPLDPHVTILRPDGQVAALSANERRPLPAGGPGLHLGRFPVYRVIADDSGWRVVVDWPLGPTLDLLHDLALVVAAAAVLAALAGALIGRSTIHRILEPVEAMARAARAMREGTSDLRMPDLGGSGDEFASLAETLTVLLQDLEAQRVRDREFLARAAHELRTPLQILSGNLRLLSTRSLSAEDEAQSLDAMQRALSRMTRLTRDLLALEHAGAVRPNVQETDLASLLEELAEDASALAPDHHLTVTTEIRTATVDEEALRQALWALVENALAYTPPGSTVTLSATTDGPWLEVAVADDGPGIPEEEQERVFERFYRGRAGALHEGTGLGLAIVRSLVEGQDGEVRLESVAPHGTRVVIRLPRQDAPRRPMDARSMRRRRIP
jgi:signal transduction histidine kinase